MLKPLSSKILKYVHGTVMDWFGVYLADDQIQEIGRTDRDLWHDLEDDNFDTVARENFADAMARFVLGSGQRWPRYSGITPAEKFREEFERAARSKGIKVL
jgi:hypothetical protein